MPKIVKQSTDPNYKVVTKPLYDEGGNFSGVYGNFRDGVTEALGFCTERYGLVQNDTLFGTVDSAIEKNKALKNSYEKAVTVVGNGERVYATYTWKDSEYNFRVGKPKVGDELGLRLTVQNSFDRSLRLSVVLGFLRLVCTNGMTTLTREFDLTRRHQSGIDTSFLTEGIDNALSKIDDQKQVFSRLNDRKITEDQGVSILGNLVGKGVLSSSMRDSIEAIWHDPSYNEDKERNLYNLLNAGTQHLTRVVEPKRYELAQRVNRDLLKSLDRASSSKKVLDKMVSGVLN